MAYYGSGSSGGGGGWYYAGRGGRGGGNGRLPYGRGAVPGAGLGVGAGWGRGRGVGEPALAMSQGRGLVVGEQLRVMGAKRAPPLETIHPEAIRAADAAAGELVLRLHPTEEAEKRRQGVINYAKRLIGTSFGCEVFAFGSVPLKTYLPDGDIDITVLTDTTLESTLMFDVLRLLETEGQNTNAQFAPKRLKFINAEVKLFKCVIDNIVVDISFNQVGGVSTLCFLELVDGVVGKDHLFKRSIILIKAWCYHECHILGAHHWLISTYALEVLVLYIFNLFHKSLHNPLEALYKFLEYYSKFEWDKYGLSLNGPVPLSALRDFTVEPTAVNDELLLGKESLKGSLDRLLVLPRGSDRRDGRLRLKYLNIIDPLKGNNNLGRSVSKGSFYRIRSAFSFGAQKLGQILMLPSELIADEIYGFFANTLKRHGRGERRDLGNSGLFQSLLDHENALSEDGSDLEISYMSEDENRSPDNSLELPDKESNVETNMHKTSGRYFPDDAKDRTWNKIWLGKSSADYNKMVPGASICAKSSYLNNFRSHSSFSPENGNGSMKHCCDDCATEEDLALGRSYMQQQHILTSSTRTNTLDASSSCPVNESNWTDAHQEERLLPPFSPSNLLDLSGDLGLHLGCLRTVQYNLEAMFDEFLKSVQEPSLAGVLDENSFEIPILRFLSNTDAGPPQLSLASFADTERRNLSPVYCSHSTGGVPHQSHTEVQVDAIRQQNVLFSAGTHILSNGWSLSPPPAADSDIYHFPWFYTTEDIPNTYGAGMYMPDMNVSWPSGTDALSMGLTFSPSPTTDSENYYVPWPYMTGDIPKTRGTGTYIPKMPYEIYRNRMSDNGRKYRQRQPDRVYPTNEHTAVGSATSQPLTEQNNSQQDADSSKTSVPEAGSVSFKEPASTDSEIKQIIPTSQTLNVQNSQQRSENVSRETQLSLPHHGGNGQGNLPVSTTSRQSSSPAATKGQGNLLVFSTSQSSSPALPEVDLEFGTLGPFSIAAKFIQDFPPLPAVKRPTGAPLQSPRPRATPSWPVQAPASTVQSPRPASGATATQSRPVQGPASTVQSPRPGWGAGASATQRRPVQAPASTVQIPRPGVTATQSRPVQAPASTVQSPRPGASAAQSRPEGSFQLKDDADFPPLQAGTHKTCKR